MPTVSESLWPELKRRYEQVVEDYVSGTDSDDVFTARLYGLGFRGLELRAELHLAQHQRIERRAK